MSFFKSNPEKNRMADFMERDGVASSQMANIYSCKINDMSF